MEHHDNHQYSNLRRSRIDLPALLPPHLGTEQDKGQGATGTSSLPQHSPAAPGPQLCSGTTKSKSASWQRLHIPLRTRLLEHWLCQVHSQKHCSKSTLPVCFQPLTPSKGDESPVQMLSETAQLLTSPLACHRTCCLVSAGSTL